MLIAPVITFHSQLPSPQPWGEAPCLNLLNRDTPHLCMMIYKWWSRLWVLTSRRFFHTRLFLDLKQVLYFPKNRAQAQSLLWLEPFKGPLFDLKTKLILVASTYLPLQSNTVLFPSSSPGLPSHLEAFSSHLRAFAQLFAPPTLPFLPPRSRSQLKCHSLRETLPEPPSPSMSSLLFSSIGPVSFASWHVS